ncbi:hypothetical protein [Thalassolituus oleivorans]|uniref:hypothetical protein n=1 Tax=Thalassolituus oleivorans TaxID=187493 RepID=UPI0023F5806B|nr:hypothetical protein [Thalassolituus oleivorans]
MNKTVKYIMKKILAIIAIPFLISCSNEKEYNLTTGSVKDGKFIPHKESHVRNIATLTIDKSYINFRPYLTNKPRDRFAFTALYPEMGPYKSNDSNKEEDFLNSISIEISLKSICLPPVCDRKVISTFDRHSEGYDLLQENSPVDNLAFYTSSSKSGRFKNTQFYFDKKNKENAFICKQASSKYTWCKYNGKLNDIMFYSFKFEQSNIENWEDIKIKVVELLDKVIVNYQTIRPSI